MESGTLFETPDRSVPAEIYELDAQNPSAMRKTGTALGVRMSISELGGKWPAQYKFNAGVTKPD